jgi:hypothetical protein
MNTWVKAVGLDPQWMAFFSQSTYRVMSWVTYRPFNEHKNIPMPVKYEDRRVWRDLRTRQAIPVTDLPRAGDIMMVGNNSIATGNHCVLIIDFDQAKQTYDTISGNGGGMGPHGNSREGISRKVYPAGTYKPMWLARPAFEDLLAEKPV